MLAVLWVLGVLGVVRVRKGSGGAEGISGSGSDGGGGRTKYLQLRLWQKDIRRVLVNELLELHGQSRLLLNERLHLRLGCLTQGQT